VLESLDTFDVWKSAGKLMLLSPEELPHAAILGIAAHLRSGTVTDEDLMTWHRLLLGVSFEFVVCTGGHDSLYLDAVNRREQVGVMFDGLFRTCVQRIHEIVQFRQNRERVLKTTISVKSIAQAWRDMSLLRP
jgi:hypothetical protein